MATDEQAPRVTACKVVELQSFCLITGCPSVKAVVEYALTYLVAATFGLLIG